MKCLCGFNHQPDNTVLLKSHVDRCMIDGALQDFDPSIVWRDGEFTVVREPKKGEQIYDIGVVRHETPEAPLLLEEYPTVVEIDGEKVLVHPEVEEPVVEEPKPKAAPKKRAPAKKPAASSDK